jgi:tetratricopeptide (TPR) repeat protein
MSQESVEEYNTVRADIDRILTELKTRIASDLYVEQHSNYRRSVSYVEQKLSLLPTLTEIQALALAYVLRGSANFYLEFYEMCRTDFEKALTINPNASLAYGGLAGYNVRNKNYTEALVHGNKAVELDPSLYEHYLVRGLIYHQLKNPAAAIQDLLKGIELNPTDYLSFDYLAVVYIGQKNWAEAEKAVNQALLLNPVSIAGHIKRALIYQGMEKHEEAIQDLDTVLTIHPKNTSAKILRGNIYYHLQQFASAEQDYRAAQKEGGKVILDIPLENVKKLPLWVLGAVALYLIPLFYFTKDLICLYNIAETRCIQQTNNYPQLALWLILAAGLLVVSDVRSIDFTGITKKAKIGAIVLLSVWGAVCLSQIIGKTYLGEPIDLATPFLLASSEKVLLGFVVLLIFGVIQEYTFRAVLFGQLYIRFSGPFKWISAIAVSQTYLSILSITFLGIEGVYNIAAFLALSYIVGGVLSWIYLLSENVFICTAISSLSGAPLLIFYFPRVGFITVAISAVVIGTILWLARLEGDNVLFLDRANHRSKTPISLKAVTKITSVMTLAFFVFVILPIAIEIFFKLRGIVLLSVIAAIVISWWYVPNEIRQLVDRKTKQAEAK